MFALIATLGGLLGAGFVGVSKRLALFRARYLAGARRRFAEVSYSRGKPQWANRSKNRSELASKNTALTSVPLLYQLAYHVVFSVGVTKADQADLVAFKVVFLILGALKSCMYPTVITKTLH